MDNKYKIILIFVGIGIIFLLVVLMFKPFKTEETGNQAVNNQTDISTPAESSRNNPAAPINMSGAASVVAGANPITKDSKVVTPEGLPTLNNVAPTSPQAPSQTPPVEKDKLAPSVIKLEVGNGAFQPREFTVKAGAPVTVAVTAVDAIAHTFVFDDPSLSAVSIGVYAKETRAVTFNAPAKPGEYTFGCNIGSHVGRGETGKMLVQ